MADRILDALPKSAANYKKILSSIASTEKIKKRPLLAKYLSKYIEPKTKDYFIHKDLESFLKRELDFYIKNEIMRLDNFEDASNTAPLENCLAEIKALRKIARCLIDFLSQLENFQRKLWLKKKFIVETQYCVTLSLIPPKHYAEIVKNKGQINEWIELFAIDELDGYSKPLTEEFLGNNPGLLIDTRFFSQEFKDEVVSSLNLSKLNGTLICSENSQALRLLRKQYASSLASIYIDPPYNTAASSILYKNGYKGSSWLSLMSERLEIAKDLLAQNGIICVAIDDVELPELRRLMLDIFPYDLGVAAVRSNPAGRKTTNSLASAHEYALFFAKDASAKPSSLPPTEKQLKRYPQEDEQGRYAWANFVRSGTAWRRADVPTMHYPIIIRDGKPIIGAMFYDEDKKEYKLKEKRSDDIVVYPTRKVEGKIVEARWHRGWENVRDNPNEYRASTDGEKPSIHFKTRMDLEAPPTTWWCENKYASANHGAASIKDYFSRKDFDFPKAPGLVEDCLRTTTNDGNAIILDYFAGSGTTPDAVINLNRYDQNEGNGGGNRRYIAVEMGAHFTKVMLPRTKKAVYAPKWKQAKPVPNPPETDRDCLGHIFKYLHLESYEDALNNLILKEPSAQTMDNEDFERDYLINYFLNFETKGSPSLLNIRSFDKPKAYRMNVKRLGGAEYTEQQVDLVETFNYMIGLHVEKLGDWCKFGGKFKRVKDPKLPKDQATQMVLERGLTKDRNGLWEFRKILGHISHVPGGGADGKVLVIWRSLSGDLEKDNLMLDEWFRANCQGTSDLDSVRIIYVNGSNNLARLLPSKAKIRICLIEEAFHKSMWA